MKNERFHHKWRVATMLGVVEVWANSEAQARSRGKWKAVHVAYKFLIAVRDCEVVSVKQLF